METVEVTQDWIDAKNAEARRKRRNGPVIIREMSEAEISQFPKDVAAIARRRGMYGF